MSRKFIALIAGTAIAITTFAAPARADNDDAAKALAVLLGLVVVGKIISDRNDDHREVYSKPRPVKPAPHPHPRPLPRQVNKKLLPQTCFRTFNTHRAQVRAFGERCLKKNYQFTRSLPRHCIQQVETRRGWGWAYGARCLRDRGYKLARH
ncbi:MAG: hypothetical protein AAFY38_14770 [Pseudomonadota bacterium]